jgi:hypothetical protein
MRVFTLFIILFTLGINVYSIQDCDDSSDNQCQKVKQVVQHIENEFIDQVQNLYHTIPDALNRASQNIEVSAVNDATAPHYIRACQNPLPQIKDDCKCIGKYVCTNGTTHYTYSPPKNCNTTCIINFGVLSPRPCKCCQNRCNITDCSCPNAPVTLPLCEYSMKSLCNGTSKEGQYFTGCPYRKENGCECSQCHQTSLPVITYSKCACNSSTNCMFNKMVGRYNCTCLNPQNF